jgi:hypothetical protein
VPDPLPLVVRTRRQMQQKGCERLSQGKVRHDGSVG